MSWLSKATGIHLNTKQLSGAVAGLATGNPLLALGSLAAKTQRSPVISGPPNQGSITLNNPFTNPSGLIGGIVNYLGGGHAKGGRIAAGPNGACPKGYHLNKHKLADGTPAHSVCVRNRHMNPANGRAIGRAITRITSGERQYKRVYTILHRHPGGKVMPKHRKRS